MEAGPVNRCPLRLPGGPRRPGSHSVFLLGVLGIFGLTFAFIITLNGGTGPTRFFLFGVLFALCFSCLLVHAFNLTKLVRGRQPLSMLVMLGLALGFSSS